MIKATKFLWYSGLVILTLSCSTKKTDTLPIVRDENHNKAIELSELAEWDSADFHFRLAEDAYLREGNWSGLSECWNQRADNLSKQGNFREAEDLLERADSVNHLHIGAESPSRASTLNKQGLLYRRMGRLDDANKKFQTALAIRQSVLPEGDPDVGWSYNNLGLMQLSFGNYRKAGQLFDSALTILSAVLPMDSPDLAIVMNNKATTLIETGFFNEAEEVHETVLDIRKKKFPSNHPTIAQSYNNLANVFSRRGDHTQAIQYIQKSIEIRLAANPGDPFLGLAYYNMAYNYLRLDSLNRAQTYFQQSLEWYRERESRPATDVSRIQDEYGMLLARMGRYGQADSLLRLALSTLHPESDPKNYRVGYIHLDLASVSLSAGRTDLTRQHAAKAMQIFDAKFGEKNAGSASAWICLGNRFDQIGKPDSALWAYQNALARVCPLFDDPNPASNPSIQHVVDPTILLDALTRKADVLARSGRPADALAAIQTAVETLDQIRAGLVSPDSKFDLLSSTRHVYEMGIEMAFALKRLTVVHELVERSKAQLLWHSFQKADWFRSAPREVMIEERELLQDLGEAKSRLLRTLLKKPLAQRSLSEDESGVFEAEQRYADFVRRMEKAYPRFAALKYRTFTPSVDTTRTLLGRESAVVEYFWGKRSLWTVCVRPDTIFCLRIDSLSRIEEQVGQFLSSLRNKRDTIFVTAAFELRKRILPDTALARNLLIVPDGPLTGIPFEALLADTVSPTAHPSRWPFLLRQTVIQYTPSVSLLFSDNSRRSSGKPVLFAPGKFK